MNLRKTRLHIRHSAEKLTSKAKTGVSLHCHTQYSKEMMDFIPVYAEKLPIINFFWRRERKKYLAREGTAINFDTAFWSPPMRPSDVYKIEKQQINRAGLHALVSITDHDAITANADLLADRTIAQSSAPISLEWTVPFEYGFFHLGVHNLPPVRALEITETLLNFTFNGEIQSTENLHTLLAMLNEIPDLLLVLNHPLWDIEIVGQQQHELLLKNFLLEFGKWLHALEVNGFRSWSENKKVIEMAEALGFPTVTGGDRHGCQPNTVLNLTNAGTFSEFADEVRNDQHAEIVLMPEYKQPLHSRQLQSFSEILKTYTEFPAARQRWIDRVYYDIGDGRGLRPLSDYWKNSGPLWLQAAIWLLGVSGSETMRPLFELARKQIDRVPENVATTEFQVSNFEDFTQNFSSDSPA